MPRNAVTPEVQTPDLDIRPRHLPRAAGPGAGRRHGIETVELLDAVYLSMVTFTTAGYGDLMPQGPLRLVLGSEALSGFVLITW